MVNENYINKSDLVQLSMVQALVTLDENTNRVLGVVKVKYNLKDKGEAIRFVVDHYIDEVNEPELRPEFIKKIEQIRKRNKFTTFNSMDEFDTYFGLKKDVPAKNRR
jgi:hypothetical protein